MEVKTVQIYETRDHDVFRRLKGNREVTNKRVAIIKESIESVGYISNPIIVNSRMEVIDGQGRLEALKQLNIPVEYRVIPGLSITECRAMNLKPTGWSIKDFVDSYAEYGNVNYVRLKKLAEAYDFAHTLIFSLSSSLTNSGAKCQDTIRNGTLILNEDVAIMVDRTCQYLQGFKEVQKKIGGRKDVFFGCVGWIYMRPNVDAERLKIAIIQNYNQISPAGKTEVTMKEISSVYNKGYSKKKHRYFDYEWKTE